MKMEMVHLSGDHEGRTVSVTFRTDDTHELMLALIGLSKGTHAVVPTDGAALAAARVPMPKAEVVDEAPKPSKTKPSKTESIVDAEVVAPPKPKRKPEPEPEPEDADDDDDEPEDEDEDEPVKPAGKVKVRITEELRSMKFRDVVGHLISLGIRSKRELVKQVEALVDEVPSVAKIAAKDDLKQRVETTAEFIDQNIKP